MAIVIEVLSKNNKTVSHHFYDKSSLTIGRGYKSDFRIDDPYVCANHIRVERNLDHNTIEFTDQTSLNGTSVNGQSMRSSALTHADILVVGRTKLRIFDADLSVAPTSILSGLEASLEWLNQLTVCLLLAVLFALITITDSYLDEIQDITLVKLFANNFWEIAAFCLWPPIIALLAKLVKKEVRIIGIFSVMWLFLILIQITGLSMGVLYFNFDAAIWLEWIDTILFSCIFFAFIWFTLFLAFHQSVRKRNILSTIATGIVLVPIIGLPQLNDSFKARPDYDSSVYPPIYIMTTPISTQQFLQDSNGLFDKLNSELADEKAQQK